MTPVVALVLLVAITIVLAVVIGTFVLTMADGVGHRSPTVKWETAWDGDVLTIRHAGGKLIHASSLTLEGPNTTVAFVDHDRWLADWDETLGAGDSNAIELLERGTYRIVWKRDGLSVTMTEIERTVG